jgi:acetyl esterase/lipase
MSIDPEAKEIVEHFRTVARYYPDRLPIKVIRWLIHQTVRWSKRTKIPVASVQDRLIPGPVTKLPIRIYCPFGTGPFPLMIFFHGGGFTLCDLDTHDPLCRELCMGTGRVVVSVHYRLAPEHKFPAASDDALAASRWIAENIESFEGNPKSIIVAGDSAGANLATVTAIRIRDQGGPTLTGQILLYPVTDFFSPPTPSRLRIANGPFLRLDKVELFNRKFFAHAADSRNPWASPLLLEDPSRLPPALVICAEFDPLLDEGVAYANKLKEAGIPVQCSIYPGMFHGFISFSDNLTTGRKAIAEICAWARNTVD